MPKASLKLVGKSTYVSRAIRFLPFFFSFLFYFFLSFTLFTNATIVYIIFGGVLQPTKATKWKS